MEKTMIHPDLIAAYRDADDLIVRIGETNADLSRAACGSRRPGG
jgi:hypothetical protein